MRMWLVSKSRFYLKYLVGIADFVHSKNIFDAYTQNKPLCTKKLALKILRKKLPKAALLVIVFCILSSGKIPAGAHGNGISNYYIYTTYLKRTIIFLSVFINI